MRAITAIIGMVAAFGAGVATENYMQERGEE